MNPSVNIPAISAISDCRSEDQEGGAEQPEHDARRAPEAVSRHFDGSREPALFGVFAEEHGGANAGRHGEEDGTDDQPDRPDECGEHTGDIGQQPGTVGQERPADESCAPTPNPLNSPGSPFTVTKATSPMSTASIEQTTR